MKKLLITLLILFSLTANAQQRGQRNADKCVITKIVEDKKVTVTTINKCKKTKIIKVYTKKEWKALLEKRKKRAQQRRGGK